MCELGIPSREADASMRVDIAIDGTDAYDANLNLIKGGGGALFREKLVELAAARFIIVADASKRAPGHLLEALRVPVEVVKFGSAATMRRVAERLAPSIRSWNERRNADGSLFETDNHNVIMDIEFAPTDLARLDAELLSAPSTPLPSAAYRSICRACATRSLRLGFCAGRRGSFVCAMEKPPQSGRGLPSFYGDWRVVDEHEFMSPTAAAVRTDSEYSQAVAAGDDSGVLRKELRELRSSLNSPQNDFAERLEEINRETSAQLDRARRKFQAIESTWKKHNFQRYLDAEQVAPGQLLSHVDQKLAQAVREVVEMKRDAETALMELTKSVESVDSLIGKTSRLKRSSSAFKQKAGVEKNSAPLTLKVQLLIAAMVSFAGYALVKYFGW
ncbi:ribose 5-phosphate epimerase [Babesia caballi]|uniref:ribose-5-phosphate isomerase n=1 Tax=Babesia caballi TaxID=5871 RepID=A0AAV4LPW7_BABCB|nr:ribose 5-phosphate epimerase [Babesia caballi]